MIEKDLQKNVLNWAKGLAPYVKAIRKEQSPYSANTGISDLIFCVWGKFLAIELKTGKNVLTEKQKEFICKIKEAGGIALPCWTLDEVKQAVLDLLPPDVLKILNDRRSQL